MKKVRDDKRKFRKAIVRCKICKTKWTAMFPPSCDSGLLQCPVCGNQQSEMVSELTRKSVRYFGYIS